LKLGWAPKHNLLDEIANEIADYEILGGTHEKWDLEQLRYDLEVCTDLLFVCCFYCTK
jgi:hypothetical protein